MFNRKHIFIQGPFSSQLYWFTGVFGLLNEMSQVPVPLRFNNQRVICMTPTQIMHKIHPFFSAYLHQARSLQNGQFSMIPAYYPYQAEKKMFGSWKTTWKDPLLKFAYWDGWKKVRTKVPTNMVMNLMSRRSQKLIPKTNPFSCWST